MKRWLFIIAITLIATSAAVVSPAQAQVTETTYVFDFTEAPQGPIGTVSAIAAWWSGATVPPWVSGRGYQTQRRSYTNSTLHTRRAHIRIVFDSPVWIKAMSWRAEAATTTIAAALAGT